MGWTVCADDARTVNSKQNGQVAVWLAGGDPVLAALGAEALTRVVKQLGGEGPLPDAGDVSLDDDSWS